MSDSGPSPATHLGLRLRRFRRLRGLKQDHVAAILGVSQGVVSRWETAKHAPSPDFSPKIQHLIATSTDPCSDRTLRSLVEAAVAPMHLICDATHRLLAASRSREREWRALAADYEGRSLWRFATPEIIMAEDELADGGWFAQAEPHAVLVSTTGNQSSQMRILPSLLRWERIGLADGRVGRLVTTVAFR